MAWLTWHLLTDFKFFPSILSKTPISYLLLRQLSVIIGNPLMKYH